MAQCILYIAPVKKKIELSHLRTFTLNVKNWNPRSSENFWVYEKFSLLWKNVCCYLQLCVYVYIHFVFGLWEYIGIYTVHYQKLIAKRTEL